jgi:ABC-2 type transport system permease protein
MRATDAWRRTRSLAAVELERAARARTTWALAGAMLVLAVLVAVGATHQAAAASDGPPAAHQARAAFGGVAALRVFVVLLGVLSVTSEYHHGEIVWRFLAEPSRRILVAAKACACAALGAVLGLAAVQVAAVLAVTHAGSAGSLGLSDVAAAQTVGGSVLGAALAGVLGVGVGAAVRNQTAAVVATLVAVLVVEPLVAGLAPAVAAFLPSAAAAAGAGDPASLGWAAGLALFAGYAGVSVAVGGALCARRDV